MAPSYLTALAILIASVLKAFNITIGTTELTTTLETVVQLGGALFVMYRQVRTGRSTVAGTRPA